MQKYVRYCRRAPECGFRHKVRQIEDAFVNRTFYGVVGQDRLRLILRTIARPRAGDSINKE